MSERHDVKVDSGPLGVQVAFGRQVIAVIGVDRYHHWQRLSNAVRDAIGTAAVFQQFGFEQVTEPLLDERATGKAIHALVTDDLKTLGPDDSLVLFYAGHGGTRRHSLGDRVIKTGYLIPVDASDSPDQVATWIDLEGWLRAVSLLPAKHILVVLDACHSGIALDPIIKWRDIGTRHDMPLSKLTTRRSRRIITSALDDQVVLDSGPIHGHSLFTGCLIEGLTHGLRQNGPRMITGSELGLYVQRRVETYPNSRQTPDFGAFTFDDRGEMVIPIMTEQAPPYDEPKPVSTDLDPTPAATSTTLSPEPAFENMSHDRGWHKIAVGAAGATLAITLIAYRMFGHPTRVAPVDATTHPTDERRRDTPPIVPSVSSATRKFSAQPAAVEHGGGQSEQKGPTIRNSVFEGQTFEEATLTPDIVMSKIQSAYMADLKRCYKEYLSKDASAHGKVMLTFTVIMTGRIVKTSAHGFASEVDACIGELMANWRFPISRNKDGEPTEAGFSITLELVPE